MQHKDNSVSRNTANSKEMEQKPFKNNEANPKSHTSRNGLIKDE
jgi:hypothetical protein